MEKGLGTSVISTILVFMLLSGAFIVMATDTVSADQSGDYTYSQSGGLATITGYTGAGGAITIPATLDTYPVVYIGDEAFMMNTNLTSVTIPNSVTKIGQYAFADTIHMTSVTIGSSVSNIGNEAFYSAVALASVTIPSSVTIIGNYVFVYCNNLTAINVAVANPNYASVDGVLYNKAVTTLIQCPCAKAGDLTVPGSVTYIGSNAFLTCRALTSVAIPNSVTNIANNAFSSCTALTAINVAAGNPNYASVDGVLYNKALTTLLKYPGGKTGAFTVPDGVTSVDTYAFSTSIHLTSVTISNSVVTIGTYAFSYCVNLTSVIIGSGVTSMDVGAFQYCSALTSMTIPAGVTTISDTAFILCTALTAFNVAVANPNYASVDGVLYDKALTTLIQYPEGKVGAFTIPNGVMVIGNYAFSSCSHLTSVVIGDDVTTINMHVFAECINLTSVVIGESVTSIGTYAFLDCYKLTSLTIGNNVTTLLNYAFCFCTSLSSIKLPDSITTIGPGAFWGCAALTSIAIPNGVTTIGNNAFAECINLTSIMFIGLGAPTTVGVDWIIDTDPGIQGHAYAASNFPAPGNDFHGLVMGTVLSILPSAPTGLTATLNNTQVVLTWNAPTLDGGVPINDYHLYRSTSLNGTYELIAAPAGLNYIDEDVADGQTYWYKVSALNANGEGTKSAVISIDVPGSSASDSTMLLIVAVIAIVAVLGVVAFLFLHRRK
ncbi:MAG: fibronectin type III domain-containing protein [Methanomassiliicoccales archaeon]|nr:fibronectin type III domain-containing protein [Methanomassiliicoccales archaeon]